jgi:hypothetical protein
MFAVYLLLAGAFGPEEPDRSNLRPQSAICLTADDSRNDIATGKWELRYCRVKSLGTFANGCGVAQLEIDNLEDSVDVLISSVMFEKDSARKDGALDLIHSNVR